MAGSSNYPSPGLEIIGKNGKYLIQDELGRGGNGTVFSVKTISWEDDLLRNTKLVIKFLTINNQDINEERKRKARFVKEIEAVLRFQDKVIGIIPIYDSSIICEEPQDWLWYVMPEAEKYNPRKYDTFQKLKQLLHLGECIKQLHKLEYAHRDIKPKNLLIYKNRLCLSDFGLIWNANDEDEHITEVNDHLGPQAIRPPELQMIERLEKVDYRSSDVYLYAKTIWMVLNCNNRGFQSEYSRANKSVFIDKSKLGIETAEPLHCLMEAATKHNYWERCDIDSCLTYLENQIRVLDGSIAQTVLNKWKYEEQLSCIENSIDVDEKFYRKSEAILQILNSMAGLTGLVFSDAGIEYGFLPLINASIIENNLFEIEIINPYSSGRNKIIEMVIKEISFQEEKQYIMRSDKNISKVSSTPMFTNIISALESQETRVCLNAEYSIIIKNNN